MLFLLTMVGYAYIFAVFLRVVSAIWIKVFSHVRFNKHDYSALWQGVLVGVSQCTGLFFRKTAGSAKILYICLHEPREKVCFYLVTLYAHIFKYVLVRSHHVQGAG